MNEYSLAKVQNSNNQYGISMKRVLTKRNKHLHALD